MRPKLLFLDEPTSGLDSAASYHVMDRIIKLVKQDNRTVIASIHQPSSEVFELFHNLCLLSSGRTVYFGSTSAANEFFTLNGFPCPPRRNPSDYYLRTVNKDFDVKNNKGANPLDMVEPTLLLEGKKHRFKMAARKKIAPHSKRSTQNEDHKSGSLCKDPENFNK